METIALVVGLALCPGVAVFFLTLAGIGLAQEYRAVKAGEEPRPGLRAATGFSGSLGIFFTILALILASWECAELSGRWRWIGPVAANLLLQPLCLLLVVGGCHKTAQALRGRATYAFRVIPRQDISEEKYRQLVVYCLNSGLWGVVLAAGLSIACLWPLLSVLGG
jgi:hypothetical protein